MIKREICKWLSMVCALVLILAGFGEAPVAKAAPPLVQNDFVISTFHGVPGIPNSDYYKILDNTKKANLTHFETTFTSPAGSVAALNIAESLGLKVIVQDYSRFGGFQNYPNQIANTTPQSAQEAVELFDSPALDGFYIWDEPFMEQIPQVKQDLDLMTSLAPDKIMLVTTLQSYSPTYTWQNGQFKTYIDHYMSEVQPPLLVFDYYVFEADIKKGISLDQSEMWKDMGYIRKKAQEAGIPFWFYIQLIGDIANGNAGDMTVPRVAVQDYVSLAFGVKGISYFNTIDGIMDINGNPNHLYNGVAALNKDILTLGRTLLNANSERVYHTSAIAHADYLDTLSGSPLVQSAPQGLFIGEFDDPSGVQFLLPVNTDYDQAKSGTIGLKNNKSVYKVNKSTGAYELLSASTGEIAFSMNAGEGELYVLADQPLASSNGGAPGKPTLSEDNGHDTGLMDGDYNVNMNLWWGNNGTVYKLFENDRLIDTQMLADRSPKAQSAVTAVTNRTNGTYRYVAELTNASGTTRSDVLTVRVTDAAPAKPVLSDNNWDGDGDFNVSMNMWWGTNGAAYRLYENGILIDTQTLVDKTPQAQSAVTAIQGRPAGVYEYRAELVNDAGAASSEKLIVVVTKP